MNSFAEKRFQKITSEVLDVRRLTPSAAIVRVARKGLPFQAGQYVRIGLEGASEIRDYSIYSCEQDEALEVLVRRVDDGLVSKQLYDVSPGDRLSLSGPYGHFCVAETAREKPLLFVATGTGIAPFHAIVGSYSALNYQLIHGTARTDEAFGSTEYGDRYVHCVSREDGGHFQGRVTEYIRTLELLPETEVYLCGNCSMIYEVFDLLEERGFAASQIHTEVYF